MRRSTAIVAVAGITAGAGVASGGIVTFNFPINVEQEVPAPDVSGFDPSGTGFVELDTSTNELSWEISYEGLTGDIVVPGAHFHGPADFGETAGIMVDIAGDAGGTGAGASLPQPPSGTLTGSFTVSDDQEAEILAGLWYVNIHTAQNPPGEIRGQVVPAPAAAAMLGLGGLAATRRRR